jgi:hypothetical protein
MRGFRAIELNYLKYHNIASLTPIQYTELEATVWGALGHPGHISYGLNSTKSKPTFCHGDNFRKYNATHFHGSRVPPGMGY